MHARRRRKRRRRKRRRSKEEEEEESGGAGGEEEKRLPVTNKSTGATFPTMIPFKPMPRSSKLSFSGSSSKEKDKIGLSRPLGEIEIRTQRRGKIFWKKRKEGIGMAISVVVKFNSDISFSQIP